MHRRDPMADCSGVLYPKVPAGGQAYENSNGAATPTVRSPSFLFGFLLFWSACAVAARSCVRGDDHQWWGPLPLRPGAWLQIGPSQLWLRQETDELRIALHTDSDPISDVLTRQLDVDEPTPPAGFELHRFAVGEGSGGLQLRPLLADRPVIARPTMPFALPSGAAVTVFISTVLWTDFSQGGVSLTVLPLFRWIRSWRVCLRGLMSGISWLCKRRELSNASAPTLSHGRDVEWFAQTLARRLWLLMLNCFIV